MHEVRCIIIKSSISLMYCPSSLCTHMFSCISCALQILNLSRKLIKSCFYYSHYYYLLRLPVVTVMLAMTVRVDLHYSKEQQINTT